jgi:hypothetical protein
VIDPDGSFSFHIAIVDSDAIVWRIDNFIVVTTGVVHRCHKKRSVEITRCLMNAQSISCSFSAGKKRGFLEANLHSNVPFVTIVVIVAITHCGGGKDDNDDDWWLGKGPKG